jgi:hypothetical protein
MTPESALVLLAFIAMFALIKAQGLRSQANRRGVKITGPVLAIVAVVIVVGAFGVGLGLCYAIWFGPSQVTGDFIGLPWLTMFPASAVGVGSGIWVNKWLTTSLLERFGR